MRITDETKGAKKKAVLSTVFDMAQARRQFSGRMQAVDVSQSVTSGSSKPLDRPALPAGRAPRVCVSSPLSGAACLVDQAWLSQTMIGNPPMEGKQ